MDPLIIDGKKIAQDIRSELKTQIDDLKAKHSVTPGLAVILVGENPASQVYVRMKGKACKEVGINSFEYKMPADTTEDKLLEQIDKLNQQNDVHGILVQLPLPKHIHEDKVLNAVTPEKDIDGFHPSNIGKLVSGQDTYFPCTPAGIQQLLVKSNIPIQSKHVVVVGRSNIVGKPIGNMLLQKNANANATVTFCHSRTADLPAITKQADILIAAIGKPEFIKKDMVSEGTAIIDVGVNRVDDPDSEKGYKLVGDVDYNDVLEKVSAITPVPGGVGPMTITMLLSNTLKACKIINNISE